MVRALPPEVGETMPLWPAVMAPKLLLLENSQPLEPWEGSQPLKVSLTGKVAAVSVATVTYPGMTSVSLPKALLTVRLTL